MTFYIVILTLFVNFRPPPPGVRSYLNGPLTGFKYIIKQINCELTNGIRGYLQMKSKKKGMGSAKVDMGFPLREKKKQNVKRS